MARRSRPRRGRDQPRHRFRSRPTDLNKQAAGIVKRLQGNRIRSVGTARNRQVAARDHESVAIEVLFQLLEVQVLHTSPRPCCWRDSHLS